ncbi:MAG TPA: SDR family NAD(P)-dependent oxidoreductase [bacterium]|nr:SDR family NAD(P)-dependent oxidoreductase [bacterium]
MPLINKSKKRKIILVTGGAGFIGSNIVEKLLQLGEKVIVFDNLSTGKKENLRIFLKNPNFSLFLGDLRNQKEIEKAVKKSDYILHQAASPSVRRSILDPKSTFETNVLGTLNLLVAAKKYKVKKLVYASSCSVYGPTKILPNKEDISPNPISPYALSKFTGEKLCQTFSKIYGLSTICLRYFNVFGPRQNPYSEYAAVIPKFVSAFLRNKKPIIYGSGQQTRDFIYVENVVDVNLKALYSKFNKGETFNIACGKQTSLLEVICILNNIFTRKVKPHFKKERPGDIEYSYANILKAKDELGYVPKVSFENGLKMTIEWFIQYEQKTKDKN